jgi:iron complex transport system ATP-binding protein
MKKYSARYLEVRVNGKFLLEPLSFEQASETVMGLYGPNGSGKSTLLKIISGVRRFDDQRGEFWLDGHQISADQKPRDRIKHILYLGSDFETPFDLSVRELLEIGATADQASLWPEIQHVVRNRMGEVIEALGLLDFLPRIFRTLSDGEKQLVMFARGVIQNPKMLVLDETFSKLDLDHLHAVSQLILKRREMGMSFIIASHDLNFLSEISDELLLLKKGVLLAKGPVAETLIPLNLNQLYPQLALQVVRSPESGKNKILY